VKKRNFLQLGVSLACSLSAALVFAQAGTPRGTPTVTAPNGYMGIVAEDMAIASTAGKIQWLRVWDGTEWKFNPQWESLSQSWTNLTGAATDDGPSGGAVVGTQETNGCWVNVDEDWKASEGAVVVDGNRLGPLMSPPRTTPFNRLMGEGGNYPPPRIVSIDYATLCMGTARPSPVQDLEALRRQNELYVGENGRYAYSNRAYLEKRAVRALPAAEAAALDAQLAAGSISLALADIAKGYRWMDRSGEWIDYNTQGQVVAFGDKNDNTAWLARDTRGIVRGVVDASGRVMFTLHYTGELLTEVRDYPIAGMALDLPPRSVKYQYDGANRLVAVIDVRGNATRYGYDTLNHVTTVTDQEGRETRFEYGGLSVKKRTAPDGGATEYDYEYDDRHKQFLTKITGPETPAGRRVDELTHNRSGRLVKRLVNGQIDKEVRYDTGVHAEIYANARGFTSRRVFNEFDQPVQLTREDGSVMKLAYSARNLELTETVDPLGVKTQYQRDTKGNLVKMVQAAGTADEKVTEYVVDGLGQVIKIIKKGRTESNGRETLDAVTAFEYDPRGQVVAMTDPEGGTYRKAHDRAGNVVSITDPLGNVARIEVNPHGLPVKVTDPMNHAWTYVYDKAGNVVSEKDPNGRVNQTSYDAAGRATQLTDPLEAKTSVQYDPQGMPTLLTDADGRKHNLEYDNFQRPIKYIDGMGNATRFGYSIADGTDAGTVGSLVGPTEVTYPTFTLKQRYDQLERLTSAKLIGAGSAEVTSGFAYDLRGAIKAATNPYGKSDLYEFDALGRPAAVTNKLGNKSRLQYDARGNLLQITDANGSTRRYEYDRNDRLVREILPLGQAARTIYDAAGNVIEQIDFSGGRSVFSYDPANRLTTAKEYDRNNALQRTVTYMWSPTNRLVGWNTTEGNAVASAVLTYDEADRISGETVTYPGGFSMGYAYKYSPAGEKTQLTWPDGTRIDYGYSAHGELETVTIPGEGTIRINQFNWRVPAEVAQPGGTLKQSLYDGFLNPTAMTVTAKGSQKLLSLSNRFGANMELSASTRTDGGGATRSSTYSYDAENRLTRVAIDSGGSTDVETFTLDAVTNRIADSRVSGAWRYDANNRLLQQGEGANAILYEYDDSGNQTKKTEPGNKVINYLYDAQSRLIAAKDGPGQFISRYGYDPMGRRMWKDQYRDKDGALLHSQFRTYFLYTDGTLVAEATQSIKLNPDGSVSVTGSPVITSQYGPHPLAPFMTDTLFIKTKNSNGADAIGYFHHDNRNAPILATDSSGSVVWAARYEAFGAATVITPEPTAEKPTITVRLRLPGQIEDEETGLHYNYYRDYDPQTGRYVQSDPIGIAGGINTYAYVGGNPLGAIDPKGLSWIDNIKNTFHDWPTLLLTNHYVNGTGTPIPLPRKACSKYTGDRKIKSFIDGVKGELDSNGGANVSYRTEHYVTSIFAMGNGVDSISANCKNGSCVITVSRKDFYTDPEDKYQIEKIGNSPFSKEANQYGTPFAFELTCDIPYSPKKECTN
jgi:RHS repeat-associated protein